jgi:hypothetical protein
MGGTQNSEQNQTNVTAGNKNTRLYKSNEFRGKGKSRTETSNPNQS